MAYTAYATTADYAAYMIVDESSLSVNVPRLLARANEAIKQITRDNIDETNSDHLNAAKLAACAQVEYWESASEGSAIMTGVKSFSIGNFSLDYSTGSGSESVSGVSQIAPRAKNYLNEYRLMYRGVSNRCCHNPLS